MPAPDLTPKEVERGAFLIEHLLTLLSVKDSKLEFDAHALASFLVGLERGK